MDFRHKELRNSVAVVLADLAEPVLGRALIFQALRRGQALKTVAPSLLSPSNWALSSR